LHASDTCAVEAVAKNVGTVAGDEVAELYHAPQHTDVSPKLALAGFKRLYLDAGEARHRTFNLYSRDLSQVDDKKVRAVFPGQSRIFWADCSRMKMTCRVFDQRNSNLSASRSFLAK
jgi:hypothetical protein